MIKNKFNINTNKKIAIEFLELAFNSHQPRLAAHKYCAEFYIQHNPHAVDGIDYFSDLFETFFIKFPQFNVDIKRIIGENDLVFVHLHAKKFPEDLGEAVVEIFRFENEKIIEHWDVVQKIEKEGINPRSLF